MSADAQIRVLVTGASGDSAQGVIRALRASGRAYFVAAVCINEHNPGFFMSDEFAVAPPCQQEEAYIDFLVAFISQHAIDALIPTIDSELSMISARKDEIERRSGAKVVVGELDAVLVCCDKLATYNYLNAVGVGQPRLIRGGFDEVHRCIVGGSSVIMKPRRGGGSKGIRLLDAASMSTDDWMREDCIYQHFESWEKEFTAVTLKDGLRIVAVVVMERILSEGRTVWCRRVRSAPYEVMLRRVAEGLDLPYLNIQFGVQGGQMQVFDLNPRFSGSTAVFARVFNGPDVLVRKAVTGSIPVFSCSENYFESIRYLADYVVDRLPDD